MAKNITYLIGAGASANTIPTVENIRGRIVMVANWINSQLNEANTFPDLSSSNQTIKNYEADAKLIVNELNWLHSESDNHQTIDTLAKKFYLIDDFDNLNRVKRALILYFLMEQLLVVLPSRDETVTISFKKGVEKRYDSLIASIVEKAKSGFQMPNNIKVLSWNYDSQFELSALNYFPKHKLTQLKIELQIIPNSSTYNHSENSLPINLDKFTLVKLNGNAIWENENKEGEIAPKTLYDYRIGKAENLAMLGRVLEEFHELLSQSSNVLENSLKYFNFSWENHRGFLDKYEGYNSNLKAAISIAKKTDILVIIGYSFPGFNRNIDGEILNNMQNVKKVYIQDKDPERIKNILTNAFFRFKKSKIKTPFPEVEYSLSNDYKQFILPYEL